MQPHKHHILPGQETALLLPAAEGKEAFQGHCIGASLNLQASEEDSCQDSISKAGAVDPASRASVAGSQVLAGFQRRYEHGPLFLSLHWRYLAQPGRGATLGLYVPHFSFFPILKCLL